MDQIFTCLLLLPSLFAAACKYVLIYELLTWHEAQNYCRQFQTELAPVSTSHDLKLLQDLIGYRRYWQLWIGLERNETDSEKWTWSGAGEVKTFFWADGQPQDRQSEDYGLMHRDKWHDAGPDNELFFFCYKVYVVRERKTWVEAVDYCRAHHSDLASVASEAEMTLIWRELEKNETTDNVWIGLRFFPGSWLWTDGQQTDYDAWGKDGKPACLNVEMECAALKMREETQSRNSTNSTLAANSSWTRRHAGSEAVHVTDVSDAPAGVKEKRWEAHDCEEKLYFVCY